MDEHELGHFIRSRREALSPSAVGLPLGTRRRTPGLRRAELATIAGISVDYLIRLEQGKDRRPSAQVLAALGDALRLDEPDLNHLRTLATITHTGELCPTSIGAVTTVRPNVQAILDRLGSAPALVVNRLSDVIAWTSGYDDLARPLGVLDVEKPNLVTYLFVDPRARSAFPDWRPVAEEHLGSLRGCCRTDDPAAIDLVAQLTATAGSEFTDIWDGRPVAQRRTGRVRLVHPDVDELRLDYETLQLADDGDNLRLIVYLPADEATSAALDRLAGRRPGALRSVTA